MKKLQVLGTGCPKCNQLAAAVARVADARELDYELEKVTDVSDIVAMGVMVTPALAVDGEVKSVGKVPTDSELEAMLG